jgi:hypothetical protein
MARALFGCINNNETINYVTIESTGNASDFGDYLAYDDYTMLSNGTNDRGIFAGGYSFNAYNVIHYVTISTTGNTSDFGDLTRARFSCAGLSNFTLERGIIIGGDDNVGVVDLKVMEYITINSAGNASDFGSLRKTFKYHGAASSKGRGFVGGTYSAQNDIDVLTIGTSGESSLFGTLSVARERVGATSNDTNERVVFVGGVNDGGSDVNTIDYITASTYSNATDFGDQSVTRNKVGATSNGSSNRGVFSGGYTGGSPTNIIDYITISSAGNTTDFGDLTHASEDGAATSNAGAGTGTIAIALNKWMGILETNLPKMLGISRATTQLSKLMGLTLTDYASLLDRGVFGGGQNSSAAAVNIIEYITISTTGNATDFGDITQSRFGVGAASNGGSDRGVFIVGYITSPSADNVNTIDYITISTTGNASDFGDNATTRRYISACSNGTSNRGVYALGYTTAVNNVIDYITINSAGNSTTFGILTLSRATGGACSNDTNNRGVFGGGFVSGFARNNTIDYITISSTGNATDFGDLTMARNGIGATSNGTNERGIFFGGDNGSTAVNVIDYITINSAGNATDFGDTTQARTNSGTTSNKTNNRGVCGGGTNSAGSTYYNIMDYITINSTGNASDFGDITATRTGFAGCSNT